ncbi:MAG: zeta toxin family protein [Prevotellaceae bacterium]|jgi:predicted ABC-type ATPase|nr:zeta toxin family protein [Prevotellaceae bacterium]
MTKTHRPILIVIAGPNGSGKTSLTSKILHHEWLEDAIYINPDIVAQELFGDWNSQEAIYKSIHYCQNLREQCLRERKSLIFETVLSAEDKVDYIHRAHEAGFFVRFFFVCTSSPTINAARIAQRVMEGGHDVPIQKIISRYDKSITNGSIISETADRTYVYDNSEDDADARLLFRMTNGTLIKLYVDTLPDWAANWIDKPENL